MLLSCTGCTSWTWWSPDTLRAESLGSEPVVLDGEYRTAFYAVQTETSFIGTDVPIEDLLSGNLTEGVVVHIELLWLPKAGATPMEESATNVSVRYIVVAGGEVGVYGGAGFAFVSGRPGKGKVTIRLRDASLTLLNSTEGFVDLLSPGRLSGQITAGFDELRARQMRFAISQLVTDALGYMRLVDAATLPWTSSWSAWACAPPPDR